MSEKLVSAEIDESRERFEKWHRRENICDDVELGLEIWQAAERDTRERIAEELKVVAGEIGSHVAYHIEEMYPDSVKATPKSFLLSVRNFTSNKISDLAERIRGVNR